MIAGIGIDLLDIPRVEKLWHRGMGGRFIERVLTAGERELLQGRRKRIVEFVAGRFAAKEAVAKALGYGIGKQIGFHDIEILPDEAGKPECRLSEAACRKLEEAGYIPPLRIHLSITHSESLAGAYAVVETGDSKLQFTERLF